jgi:hypothetical protein
MKKLRESIQLPLFTSLNSMTKSGKWIEVNLIIDPLEMRSKEHIGYIVRIEPIKN